MKHPSRRLNYLSNEKEKEMTQAAEKKTEIYRLTHIVKTEIEIYPHDLPKTMTYLDAVKAVEKLGDGWRIPTREELMLMYKNKDEIGGFKTEITSGSAYPDWYWSSTEYRDNPSLVWDSRFSDGFGGWDHKDYIRLSCRPVRLVEVAAP